MTRLVFTSLAPSLNALVVAAVAGERYSRHCKQGVEDDHAVL